MRHFHVDPKIPSTDNDFQPIIQSIKTLGDEPVNEEWFERWSTLQCLFSDGWLSRFWSKQQDLSSEENAHAYKTFSTIHRPLFEEHDDVLVQKAFDYDTNDARFQRIISRLRNDVPNAEGTIDFTTKIRELTDEFEAIDSKQMVNLDEPVTRVVAQKLLREEWDSGKREKVWHLVQDCKLKDAKRVGEIMVSLVQLRNELAEDAGVPDFRAYSWHVKHRTDYTPDDNLRCLDLVEEVFAPSYETFASLRKETLQLTDYRPWDVQAPLVANHKVRHVTEGDYLTWVRLVFDNIKPTFGQVVEDIIAKGHVDLMNRPNKATFNFSSTFASVNEPVVSCNLTGALNQVNTAFHEFGHAVHHACINPGKLFIEKNGPKEVNEFVANVFQLFAYERLDLLGFSQEECRNYRFAMLDGKLELVKEFTHFDRFQHWLFTLGYVPDVEQMNTKFIQLASNPLVNWRGLENYQKLGWHHDHVIGTPFYTVEYVFSWIAALLFYKRYRCGQVSVDKFLQGMQLGNTRTAKETFAFLGIAFPFEAEEIYAARDALDLLLNDLL